MLLRSSFLKRISWSALYRRIKTRQIVEFCCSTNRAGICTSSVGLSHRYDNAESFLQCTSLGKVISIPTKRPNEYMQINNIWLRENCRCENCYTVKGNQRNLLFQHFDSNVYLKETSLSDDRNTLQVLWSDGHESWYNLDWLPRNLYPGSHVLGEKYPWDAEALKLFSPTTVDFQKLLESDESLKQVLSDLVKYGFALVGNVPATEKHSMQAAERVSFVQETFYGRQWTFSADMARADTAYTNLGLGAHTDTTYSDSPAGIQVFHCLHHDGAGGETLLVDGLHCVSQLQAENTVAFKLLCEQSISNEYLENEMHHMISMTPVILTTPGTGEFVGIRYNPYHRAPISTISQDEIGKYYAALRHLASIIEDKQNEHWIKLLPGTMLFIDNWRVMHGRSAYTGHRVVTGVYLPRDDWLSKARIMGVL